MFEDFVACPNCSTEGLENDLFHFGRQQIRERTL
jgi:hypothetical protein